MTEGEAPQPPAPSPAPPPGRPNWRKHPLAKRLPILLFAALGFWLWKHTGTPTRDVVWQFDGYGWGEVRAIDFQVTDAEGHIVEREERFFGKAGPPPELTTKMELPAGTYQTRLFVKREGQEQRALLVEPLTLSDETYSVHRVRLPGNR